MGELSSSDAYRVFDTFSQLTNDGVIRLVAVDNADFLQATDWLMMFQKSLRTPDALHVSIAKRLGATFWTLDKPLAEFSRWIGLPVGDV